MHIVIRLFITCLLALIAALHVVGQQLQVIDKEGNPIAYVCVTDANGVLIGTTDLNGVLSDLKGAPTINLTHVAYTAATVNTADIADGKITLTDVDFDLPEVTVKPKELIYVQTYFRLIYVDNDGPIYYRAGVIDNTYDIAKQKISSKAHSLSRGKNGLYRFVISTLVGRYIDNWGQLDETPYYRKIIKQAEKGELTLSGDHTLPGRTFVSDTISTLGFIDNDTEQSIRTTSFDLWTFRSHKKTTEEKAKAAKKNKEYKPKERSTERNHNFFEVYRIDNERRSSVADFVMRQFQVDGHHVKSGDNYTILFQAYNTEVNYIDKKEYKNLRKENKVDMEIEELRRFEKAHKIPPLAPEFQSAIDQLFEKH